MEPLAGYLLLAEKLSTDDKYASAFNFGPNIDDNRSVEDLIKVALEVWPGKYHTNICKTSPVEAGLLKLTIDKAQSELKWYPKWHFEMSVRKTIEWYKEVNQGVDPLDITLGQIKEYIIK